MEKIMEKSNLINDLDAFFQERSAKSLTIQKSKAEEYLCVRLDGFKLSKRFLKAKIVNKAFTEDFLNSIESVYYYLRYHIRDRTNFFLSIFSASDEVSFILSNKENFYKNRCMKISSIICGLLSSSMSLKHGLRGLKYPINKKDDIALDKIPLIAFDARPVILKNIEEVKQYLNYRWLISCRNAMSKILRLKGDLDVESFYASAKHNDMNLMSTLIEDKKLRGKYYRIIESSAFFLPSKEGEIVRRRFSKDLPKIDDVFCDLESFNEWLCNTEPKLKK